MAPVLIEEEPFACVVLDEYGDSVCAFCFKRQENLKRCAGCYVLRYCSKKCQRSDFADHKEECGHLARSSTLDCSVNFLLRLIGRVILKLKRKTARAFNERTFDSLEPSFRGTSKIPNFVFPEADHDVMQVHDVFTGVNHDMVRVRDYLFGEDLPPSGELVKIWRKIVFNLQPIAASSGELLGCGIYLGTSELGHSCDPDVYCLNRGRKQVVRAAKPGITSYSGKLKRCYDAPLCVKMYRHAAFECCHSIMCGLICTGLQWDLIAMSLRCTRCSNGYCICLNEDLTPLGSPSQCAFCGKETSVEVSDGIEMIAEIGLRLRPLFPVFTPLLESAGRFEHLSNLQLYKQAKELLSVGNRCLYQLGRYVMREMHLSLTDTAMISEGTLECMKFYLTKSSPILSEQYLDAGICQLKMEKFDNARTLTQKAAELLARTHGADHWRTKKAIAAATFCDEFIGSRKRMKAWLRRKKLDPNVVKEKVSEFLDSPGKN